MKKIDPQSIDKLAHLARLSFNDSEKLEIESDLNKILSFVDKLSELDTTGVEPLIYMTNEHSVLRDDTEGDMLSQKEALKNAPDHDSDYFRVPKVVDKN
jgi:aspartyl-tRNA(Asn)/glutamyl-tRNA(Gln) amidotransferase subunit C